MDHLNRMSTSRHQGILKLQNVATDGLMAGVRFGGFGCKVWVAGRRESRVAQLQRDVFVFAEVPRCLCEMLQRIAG